MEMLSVFGGLKNKASGMPKISLFDSNSLIIKSNSFLIEIGENSSEKFILNGFILMMITFVKLEFLFNPMNLFKSTSCVILSAGNSERMDTHKALLKYDSNFNFLEKLINTYLNAGLAEIVVVLNEYLFEYFHKQFNNLPKQIILVENLHPEYGRFYSLKEGLKQINSGNSCFFQNIDNPFTSASTLLELVKSKNKADVIIPVINNMKGHPVLINSDVVYQIVFLNSSEIAINKFIQEFKVFHVKSADSNILTNINLQSDYDLLFSCLKNSYKY